MFRNMFAVKSIKQFKAAIVLIMQNASLWDTQLDHPPVSEKSRVFVTSVSPRSNNFFKHKAYRKEEFESE